MPAKYEGYIYLVWAEGTDKYKIGSSVYPERRLQELQTGSPFALKILAVQKSGNPEMEERLLHKQWSKSRIQGEWFQFNPLQIPEVLSGFGKADPFTVSLLKRYCKALDDVTDKAIATATENMDKAFAIAHDALDSALDYKLEPDLSLVGAKSFEDTLYLLTKLSHVMPSEKAIQFVDDYHRFKSEVDWVAFNIERKI